MVMLPRKRRESPEAVPTGGFPSPEAHRDRAFSYQSTLHERDEADRALSSLELMVAPSPPMFPLSLTPVRSVGYPPTEARSPREFRC